MGSERPPDDARFEGLGDWLVSHGQDALARGTGKGSGRKGPARWSVRRMVRMAVRVLIVVALAWLVLSSLTGPIANYLWFQNVGFGSVWAVQFTYALALFLAGLVGGSVVLLVNLVLAWRLSRRPGRCGGRGSGCATAAWTFEAPPGWPPRPTCPAGRIRRGLVVVALALALLFGLLLTGTWQTVALWLHQVPYATSGAPVADPIFGYDLGWWMFTLPFLHLVATVAAGLFLSSLLVAGVAYGIAAVRGAHVTDRGPMLHLAVLGGLLLAAVAAMQWLGRYDLSFAQNGFVSGGHRRRRGSTAAPGDRHHGIHGRRRGRARGPGRPEPRPARAPRRPRGRHLVPGASGGRSGPPVRLPAAHRDAQPEPGRGALHRQQHRPDPARLRARHVDAGSPTSAGRA